MRRCQTRPNTLPFTPQSRAKTAPCCFERTIAVHFCAPLTRARRSSMTLRVARRRSRSCTPPTPRNESTSKISMTSIGTLKPYRNNARTHSKKQIQDIANSIARPTASHRKFSRESRQPRYPLRPVGLSNKQNRGRRVPCRQREAISVRATLISHIGHNSHCHLGRAARSNRSPHRDSAKRELFNNYVETFGAIWEFGFDSGTRRDSVPRKSPLTAGQIVLWIERGPETRLAGWRRSADGPLLCPFSLLTGNFTGNFVES
jgi:hypothetical protein